MDTAHNKYMVLVNFCPLLYMPLHIKKFLHYFSLIYFFVIIIHSATYQMGYCMFRVKLLLTNNIHAATYKIFY